MDAEQEKILGRLVGAGIITNEQQAMARATLATAARSQGQQAARSPGESIGFHFVVNKNYILITPDEVTATGGTAGAGGAAGAGGSGN